MKLLLVCIYFGKVLSENNEVGDGWGGSEILLNPPIFQQKLFNYTEIYAPN